MPETVRKTSDTQVVYSMCGMCSVRCPIQVEVTNNRATWVQGNVNDKGMASSLCPKGVSGLSLEYEDNERPQQPMIRTGPRGSGQWRKASWEEALDYVAEELKKVMDKYGGQGVVLSDRGGPFNDLHKAFIKALGSPNYFNHDCTCGRNTHHATQSIFGVGRKGIIYDIPNTKHIVLYGRNLLESLHLKTTKQFMKALDNGAKCTYIDPRSTFTASKANRFWQIRPNSEYAINLSLIREILEEGLYDKDFVARWATGLEEMRSAVAECTPEWQEQYTDVPASEIREFAREIAEDAPQVMFHAGWMTARHGQSFYTARTAHILNALLGAVEVPGGIPFSKKFKDAGYDSLKTLGEKIPKPEAKRVDGCGWKYPHFDAGPGLLHLLFPAIDSGDPYPVGAYITYRHDPMTGLPDPEAIKKSLDKLDLVVAIDIHYSEFAWRSDVILPECTYLERANLLAERNGLKPNIQMRDQAVPPRFDTRPGWWIFKELAKRLGKGEYFDFESIEDIWAYQLEGSGISIDAIRNKGVYSLVDKPIMYDRETSLPFKTPSGKIEFISSKLSENGFDSIAPFTPPDELAEDEFKLLFGRSAIHTHGQSINNPRLHELVPDNPVWIHPDRAKALGIDDGSEIEVSNNGYTGRGRAKVTPWIHPNAVFMLHGFGRTVPAQTRAYNKGIADQRLQVGYLTSYDPAGGGNNLTECSVRVRPAKAPKGDS